MCMPLMNGIYYLCACWDVNVTAPSVIFYRHSSLYIALFMLEEIKMLLAWDSEIPTLFVHIDCVVSGLYS